MLGTDFFLCKGNFRIDASREKNGDGEAVFLQWAVEFTKSKSMTIYAYSTKKEFDQIKIRWKIRLKEYDNKINGLYMRHSYNCKKNKKTLILSVLILHKVDICDTPCHLQK